jgi:hypothetical protein
MAGKVFGSVKVVIGGGSTTLIGEGGKTGKVVGIAI